MEAFIALSLYRGKLVRLAPFRPDTDCEALSRWSHDVAFGAVWFGQRFEPKSTQQVQTWHAERSKGPMAPLFSIRALEDDRIIGIGEFYWWSQVHGTARLRIAIASNERGHGYGTDCMGLLLRLADEEYNLVTVVAASCSADDRINKWLQVHEFELHESRREAIWRDGTRHDFQLWSRMKVPTTALSPNPSVAPVARLRPDRPLLRGELTHLCAINADTDSSYFARWNEDSEFYRLFDDEPAQLFTHAYFKEWIANQTANEISFLIRAIDHDKPIGMAGLHLIAGPHRDAFISIGIGEREYWSRGYGSDALGELLRYSFCQLDLHRVSLGVFEYNTRAQHVYKKFGFVVEGRRPNISRRGGKRWGSITMGLLQSEWRALNGY